MRTLAGASTASSVRSTPLRRALPPAQILIEALLLDVALQHLEPDELRLTEIAIRERDLPQPVAQGRDRQIQRLLRLMVGSEFSEQREVYLIGAPVGRRRGV